MRTLLHISDIHFGPAHSERAARDLLALIEQRRPTLLVVSGDLTQRAKPRQFRLAREYLDRTGIPSVVVPGNHDVPLYRFWERAVAPFRAYRRHFSSSLEGELRESDIEVFGINSAYNWTTKHGSIRRSRLAQLPHFFGEASRRESGTVRVVVVHHPIVLPSDFHGERIATNGRRAADCFAEAGVDLVLSGHVHRFYLASAAEFYPRLSRHFWVLHAGTTTSTRGRGPERGLNSCNWIEFDRDQIRVERLLRSEGSSFVTESEHLLAPPDAV